MNWVLISVLAILAICGYAGWRKGIIKIVLSIATIIITIVVTVFAAPLLGRIIKESTTLYDNLYQSVKKAVVSSELFDRAVEETVEPEEVNRDQEFLAEADEQKIKDYVGQVVEMLSLPESIAEQVEDVVDAEYIVKLQEEGNTAVSAVISSIIAERMTQIIFNTIIHMIVFISLFIILRIVVLVTGIIGKLPVIHEANKLLGLAVGLVEGLFFVWIFFALITAFGNQKWAAEALTDISSSRLLSIIYNNNLILKSVFRSL